MNKGIIKIKHLSILALLPFMVLAGCSFDSGNMSELEEYVQAELNRPAGPVEPIPEFTVYDSFAYSAASLRGPFDVPILLVDSLRNQNASPIQPDETRTKELLESFSIGALTMVGTMARNNQIWALILDENSSINRVTTGNYLGKNYGRIVSINSNQVNIIEVVPNGNGGWIERPQVITLTE